MINFEARMYLDGDGAFSVADDNKTVNVKGGTSNTIYVVGATNYVDYKTLDNDKPARDCEYYMNNVKSKTYEQIKARHLADFTEQFSKTDLTLDNAEGKDYSDTPTEERVREPKDGKSRFARRQSGERRGRDRYPREPAPQPDRKVERGVLGVMERKIYN